MVKTVPKSSMIGAVLSEGPDCHPIIVESGGFSLFQHNPFLWEVDVESATFVENDGSRRRLAIFDSTLDAWMDKYSLAERARFCRRPVRCDTRDGCQALLRHHGRSQDQCSPYAGGGRGLDPDLQQFIRDVLRSFARTATVEKAAGAASGIAGTIKKARPSVALAVTTFKNRGEGSD